MFRYAISTALAVAITAVVVGATVGGTVYLVAPAGREAPARTITATQERVVTRTETLTTTVTAPIVLTPLKIAWTGAVNEIFTLYPTDAGIFRSEGLDVTLVKFGSGRDAVGAVISGDVDVYPQVFSGLVLAKKEGADLFAIYEIMDRIPLPMVTKVDSKINAPADMKGTKVGITRAGSASWFQAVYWARSAGLDETKDMTIIATGTIPALFTALVKGDIDVGFPGEPFISQGVVDGVLRVIKDPAPLDNWLVLVRGKDVKDRPAILRALTRAYFKAISDLAAGTPKALEAAKKFFPDLKEAVVKRALDNTIPFYNKSGRFTVKHLDDTMDFLLLAKLLETKMPLDQLLDNRFFP